MHNEDNSVQKRLRTPTLREYREILHKTQHAEDNLMLLRQLMKEFSANFYNRKMLLRKTFLQFDLGQSGFTERAEFLEALNRTNPDFSRKQKNRLVNYIFATDD